MLHELSNSNKKEDYRIEKILVYYIYTELIITTIISRYI